MIESSQMIGIEIKLPSQAYCPSCRLLIKIVKINVKSLGFCPKCGHKLVPIANKNRQQY